MNKYGNKKIKTEDGLFDSLREFRRWRELRLLQMAGEIKDLRRQVKFVIIPSQRDSEGRLLEREASYIADFVYSQNGVTVVEDTKGMRTRDYILKRKLMLKVFGIRIKEI